eukprot:3970455-Alexandrium_andersonii.AAC.1
MPAQMRNKAAACPGRACRSTVAHGMQGGPCARNSSHLPPHVPCTCSLESACQLRGQRVQTLLSDAPDLA